MSYLLDTNACIRYLRDPKSRIGVALAARSPSDICMSSVVLSELYRGALRSRKPAEERQKVDVFVAPFRVFAFDTDAAERHAAIRVDLERRGLLIGPYDLLIAATAASNSLTLVTHNTAEFSRIPNLVIEDWELP